MRDCRDGGKMRRAKRNAAGFLQWWVICHLTYRFVDNGGYRKLWPSNHDNINAVIAIRRAWLTVS